MPDAVRSALTALRKEQAADRLRLGPHYQDRHDLVFRDHAGRPMSRQRMNLRFKDVLARPGSAATGSRGRPGTRSCPSRRTTARASRTSRTRPGTSTRNVTRAVYRHQICDTVTRAPAALDQALAAGGEQE